MRREMPTRMVVWMVRDVLRTADSIQLYNYKAMESRTECQSMHVLCGFNLGIVVSLSVPGLALTNLYRIQYSMKEDLFHMRVVTRSSPVCRRPCLAHGAPLPRKLPLR
jgi:hypothetical protein